MRINLITVEDFTHYSEDGEVLTKFPPFTNTLHDGGIEMILDVLFNGTAVPARYYVGLDNRSSVSKSDTMASLNGEPTQNGYARVGIEGGNIETDIDGRIRILTPIVTFRAVGGSWGGVVSKMFLCDTETSSGTLIATASLPSSVNMIDGQIVTYRMRIGLDGCS